MEAQEEPMESKEHTQITKRKRTKRHRSTSPLSPPMATTSSSTTSPSTSINNPSHTSQVEQDTANCLILLAQGQITQKTPPPIAYQCKTCTRGFPSFQALGGHRASHKKPKAIIEECKLDINNTSTTLSLQLPNKALSTSTNTKSKVHECSICGAEFTSGQALGGHMRRHRTIIPMATTSGSNPSENDTNKPRNFLSLDLNLPAPDDDHGGPKLQFTAKEQVIVFSASSLVDCHY